jgi:Chaperone of endosialidase
MWIIRGFLLIPLALALGWFALSPTARAVSPPPDGGYPNGNTAEGTDALFSLSTGTDNTAIGNAALFSNTTGSSNTANGLNALYFNINGIQNTASGFKALFSNTTGGYNTAVGASALTQNTIGAFNTANGVGALESNTIGNANTAIGVDALHSNTNGGVNIAIGLEALFYNTSGYENTATGVVALEFNTTGSFNTANGWATLTSNTTGNSNTANGYGALFSNTTGNDNTANGAAALYSNSTGNNNIALGVLAGSNRTTGSNNIDIGNKGAAGKSNIIRIGTNGTQKNAYIAGISGVTVAGGVGVIIDTDGHLGTVVSSERYKDGIKPMDNASEAILALKPVTFCYKHELDSKGILQFGLVAEQVEKVNPDLVARDDQGKAYTVRYEAVNAMLLNEFLKEHRKVQELEVTVAQQQKDFQALTASVREQASQIQKVSDQLELSKAAPRMVLNNQ